MPLPKIDEQNRRKPLSYDPDRKKFITFDEIVSGQEKMIPVDNLSDDDFQKLIIERQRRGPDYKVQGITGPPLSRDDVIRSIERNDQFGRLTKEAERSYLKDFNRQIQVDLWQGSMTKGKDKTGKTTVGDIKIPIPNQNKKKR